MNVFLVTDDEKQGAAIRTVLLREGLDCPVSSVVRLALAPQYLSRSPVDLIVVVLPEDPERSLGVLDWLAKLPRQNGERVVAVGPAADPKLVLRALRGAVDDYLDQHDLEPELIAALERWRASKAMQEDAGRVIAVLAPSGGSGSSTLAVNIATVLAKQHKSAALFDMKLQTGDLAALMDLKPTYTLADLCQNVARLDRTLFERSLVRHASGVSLLAPPRHFDDIARITPDGVHQALNLAKALFPYVVIDLDHSFRPEQIEVLNQAEVILLVLRLDFSSLRNTRRTLEYLERHGDQPGAHPAGGQPLRPAQGGPGRQGRGGPGHESLPLRPRGPQGRQPRQQQRRPGRPGGAPGRRLPERHQAGPRRQRAAGQGAIVLRSVVR